MKKVFIEFEDAWNEMQWLPKTVVLGYMNGVLDDSESIIRQIIREHLDVDLPIKVTYTPHGLITWWVDENHLCIEGKVNNEIELEGCGGDFHPDFVSGLAKQIASMKGVHFVAESLLDKEMERGVEAVLKVLKIK